MSYKFDWDKAAEIIKEKQPDMAEAGLAEDWWWTAGPIYRDGKPIDAEEEEVYTWLTSYWATPVIRLNGDEVIECSAPVEKTQDAEDEFWPETALEILNS